MTIRDVEDISRVTPEVLDAVHRLLPQLSRRSERPDHASLARVVDSPDVHLLLAVDDSAAYVGMLSLVLTPLPTGVRARIEDVVVDAGDRGGGVGRVLAETAVDIARRSGARDVDLTARAERRAAIALYESLGFARRETSVYRLSLNREVT